VAAKGVGPGGLYRTGMHSNAYRPGVFHRLAGYGDAVTSAAGYSGTPLPAKLGIRAGSRVLLDGAPADLPLAPMQPGVVPHHRAGAQPYDVVLLFAPDAARLHRRWPALAPRLTSAGRLWVCWPRRSSGVPTDLGDAAVRAHGLARGLVDVKVCAVDANWSGLAFVRRRTDR
jgi:hypothetical protein